MLTGAPRGTNDILPSTIKAWRYVEQVMREVCKEFNYEEIRTPIFEHTELFKRGIGDATDVVDKEMYTFTDRGGRSVTLRPENTASVVRSFVENKMYGGSLPVKVFYIGPMFRYDRPQAGRLRQFHQFGVEAIGSDAAVIDAECIMLAVRVLEKLGLKDLKLKLNSVGCPKCRPLQRKALQEYFSPHIEEMCEDCKERINKNPLRLLDCKDSRCQKFASGAPNITDYLCPECEAHLKKVEEILTAAGISYVLDSTLVRGLDYYTKTAFEIQYTALGAQSAVAGGGRYDGLVEEIGGPAMSGIGFAMGIERVLLALGQQELLPSLDTGIDIFAVVPDQKDISLAFSTISQLRDAGFSADVDSMGRSFKAQMKQADRLKAKKAIIFGADELTRGAVMVKDMVASSQKEVPLTDLLAMLKEERG